MTNGDWKHLKLSRTGRILEISFVSNNKINALTTAVMRELHDIAVALQDDSELNAIILTGSETVFSGGLDLKDEQLREMSKAGLAERRKFVQLGPKMCAAWEQLEPVTIAAIEGWCIGGGVALVSALDWRVAASDATIQVPELKIGMTMSWQSVPRFVNLIGPARTKQLLILAQPLPAATALEWGLIDRLAEPGEALACARDLARQVAAMPPVPVRMCKQAIHQAAASLNHATSYMDADQFLLANSSEDSREGIAALFEKRPARFTGR
jgi:enoyl-CoA hydratase